ncbi:MAG: C39 family peptidase [Oscillospiraceae bacterium]|nr:C39 family peptidase [Oscillospiraceae bacterium]
MKSVMKYRKTIFVDIKNALLIVLLIIVFLSVGSCANNNDSTTASPDEIIIDAEVSEAEVIKDNQIDIVDIEDITKKVDNEDIDSVRLQSFEQLVKLHDEMNTDSEEPVKEYEEHTNENIEQSLESTNIIVLLDVPSYDQRDLGYPLGCELVSLAMLMNFKTEVDIKDLYDDLPRADHPEEGFRGDPASSSRGWTIFPSALKDMMEKYIDGFYDMSGLEMADLMEQLDDNKPIMVWIKGMGWAVHALCLTGYDEQGFYYNDPWTGEKNAYLSFDNFYEIWNEPIYDSVLELTYEPRKAMSY